MVCGRWPTTYMTVPSMSALLEPPATGKFTIGLADAFAQGAVLQGSSPDC